MIHFLRCGDGHQCPGTKLDFEVTKGVEFVERSAESRSLRRERVSIYTIGCKQGHTDLIELLIIQTCPGGVDSQI